MLSWVLASASPTPNASAHQSKTMVTGRVCKNVLGLFSKGAQETLEVKLRLVPVPTVMQSEYVDSMQRYRELSNVIPHEFDAQSWTNFLRQNPNLLSGPGRQQLERITSPMDHSGIQRFHELLSAGSTPREFPSVGQNEQFHTSPPQSAVAPSRHSTPGTSLSDRNPQPQQQLQFNASHSDVIRPQSSASMQETDFSRMINDARRGSIQSGYGSTDEWAEPPARKRAKLYRADGPGRSDLNIEKQPNSLRVAASTAASVRIHRPTPMNPAITAAQNTNVEPIRPPTPISNPSDIPRRAPLQPSTLCESSAQPQANAQYTSPYPMSDDHPMDDQNEDSPEESRYQGLFEPPFSMPSSPPVLDSGFPGRSSPNLPPIPTDPDSGFMSGNVEDADDDIVVLDDCQRTDSGATKRKRAVVPAVAASSPAAPPASETQVGEAPAKETEPRPTKEAPPQLPRAPSSAAGSRPTSRASVRPSLKPLAPAPMSQSDIEQIMGAVPASDPVMPTQGPLQHSHPWSGPMSDAPDMETPGPQPVDSGKVRSGAGSRKSKQVQARLDQCIRQGQAPPFCENCGQIETPTWRRAWSREIVGNEDDANEMAKDSTVLFWESVEKDNDEKVTKFKIVKKTLQEEDAEFTQILLCNPCGLWLQKFKNMRPENKWNGKPLPSRRKRDYKKKGPLNGGPPAKKPKRKSKKGTESSPPPSDFSSPPVDDEATPRAENNNGNDNDEETQEPPSKRRRANSVQPRNSSDTAENHWQVDDPMEALRRALQSSPVRNIERRAAPTAGANLTPKPVRRCLFPGSHGETLKPLAEASGNSPRRSPRIASHSAEKGSDDKENQPPAGNDDIDGLFESPTFEFNAAASPTPKRRNPRANVTGEKRSSLPNQSPNTPRRSPRSNATPTKFRGQKLQRIQGSASITPRANKTPKQTGSNIVEMPPFPDDFNIEGFEGMDDMIASMFDGNVAPDSLFDPSRYQENGDWPGWFASDGASAIGSEGHQTQDHANSEDILNAFFSDPDINKESLPFDPFAIDTGVLESGFLRSDALPHDMLMGTGNKAKSPGKAKGSPQRTSPRKNVS